MTETYETTINGEVWQARVDGINDLPVKAARAVAYMESAGDAGFAALDKVAWIDAMLDVFIYAVPDFPAPWDAMTLNRLTDFFVEWGPRCRALGDTESAEPEPDNLHAPLDAVEVRSVADIQGSHP